MKMSSPRLSAWACWGLLAVSLTAPAAPYESVKSAAKPTLTVTIDAFQFQPEELRIKLGQSVIFVNKDAVPHTVTPGKDAHFLKTGIVKGGEQRTVLFESPGIQDYSCDFHPSMKGRVVVE